MNAPDEKHLDGSRPEGLPPIDPDLAGMPPGIVMPDEHEYRRGQYLARLITESIALCIVIGLLLLPGQRQHMRLLLICGGIVAAIALLDLGRYLRARRPATR